MRERFEALGGRIEFRSAEGHGFDLRGVLPSRRGPS
jgi:signal transduction histidine kinase